MSASFAEGANFIRQTKTISVTSGKGGVGKSTLLSNLAISLARQNYKVLILDGDLGLANIDIMFGVRSRQGIETVISGENDLSEILIQLTPNVTLIPGGSGVYGMQTLSAIERQTLLDQVTEIDGHYDFMLVDTASGIDDNVLYLNAASQETLVVLTPDPSSLADAYALIKVLNQKYGETHFSVVANMVRHESEALKCFQRLSDVSQRFLNIRLSYKGFVPFDQDLSSAVQSQHLITRENSTSMSAQAIHQLAQKLAIRDEEVFPKGGMQFFWEQLVGRAS